jgi:hypothetical protein
MWHDLIGKPIYYAGAAGTVTVGFGEVLHIIVVHSTAGGTFTIFGGASIPVIATAAPTTYQFYHTLFQSNSANGGTIVFTGTDSYFVHTIREGNA